MPRGLHWFRNDLRLQDNTALASLAARADQWLPVFVLDPRILDGPNAGAPRARFLLDCLSRLGRDLSARGVPLLVRQGRPKEVLPRLLGETRARLLSFNAGATPFAKRRDAAVMRGVERGGGEIIACRDDVIFGADEVRSASGGPYAVYSPYRAAWWRRWVEEARLPVRLARVPPPIPGFRADTVPEPRALGLGADGCALPTGGERAARRRHRRNSHRVPPKSQ